MISPSVSNIVSFILRYRGTSKAFEGATAKDLSVMIGEAIMAGNCVVDHDVWGRISGVIVGKSESEKKTIHIVGLLCVKRQSLVRFASWLNKSVRSDWTLTATRRGKPVVYKTETLLKKLIAYG